MADPIPAVTKSTTGHALRPLVIPWPVRAGFRLLSTVSTVAAARLARRLFFAPPLAATRQPERETATGGEAFSFLSRGESVKATTWGSGPVVALVHGWAGNSGQMAALVPPLAAAGFRVVAPDMPGHGESEGKLSSVVHFAEALRRLEATVGPLHGLVAHSFGAAAATFALANGLRVERAVFFAPPARFDSFWTRFQDGLGMSEAVRRRLTADAEAWLGVRFEDAAPVANAPRMTAPLLILHDAGDREVAFAEGVELGSKWPGATLRPTEGLGHLRILRDPDCLAAATEFLIGHSTVTRKNFTELSSFSSMR